MAEFQEIYFQRNYDPHSIVCFILLFFYCLGSIDIKPSILLSIFDPTGIKSLYVHDKSIKLDRVILKPTLECLIQMLIEIEEQDAALQLIQILDNITNFHYLVLLREIFNQKAIQISLNDRQNTFFKRLITKYSVFYQLINRGFFGFRDSKLVDENIHASWWAFNSYKDQFKNTALYQRLRSFLPVEKVLFTRVFDIFKDSDELQYRNGSKCTYFPSTFETDCALPWLIVTPQRFESILECELIKFTLFKNEISDTAQGIVKYTSIHDKTIFTKVLFIEYMIASINKNYEEAHSLMYRFFDYYNQFESCQDFSFEIKELFNIFILGNFYLEFGTPEVAMKKYEDIINLIRERGSLNIGGTLVYSLFIFLINYPQFISNLSPLLNELKKYFQSLSEKSVNDMKFLYSMDFFFSMCSEGYVPFLLELNFIIQALYIKDTTPSIDKNADKCLTVSLLWHYLGINDLKDIYESILDKPSDNEDLIQIKFFLQNDMPMANKLIKKLEIKELPYHQLQELKLLKIQYLQRNDELNNAMILINQCIDDTTSKYLDARWKFEFLKAKFNIMLSCGLTARAIPILMEIIDNSKNNKNSYMLCQSLLMLCKALNKLKKYDQSIKLLEDNMHVVLQFNQMTLTKTMLEQYIYAMESQNIINNDTSHRKQLSKLKLLFKHMYP